MSIYCKDFKQYIAFIPLLNICNEFSGNTLTISAAESYFLIKNPIKKTM